MVKHPLYQSWSDKPTLFKWGEDRPGITLLQWGVDGPGRGITLLQWGPGIWPGPGATASKFLRWLKKIIKEYIYLLKVFLCLFYIKN